MSIKADIDVHHEGKITIHMAGGLNYETGLPLRQKLVNLTRKYPTGQITLNFQDVDFVGSSGIGTFVETLKLLDQQTTQISIINVKSEFLKVFRLYNIQELSIFVEGENRPGVLDKKE